MAEKKMTKKEMLAQIKANYDLTDKEIAFIDHEIELLSKKNSKDKGQTKTQKENENIKAQIVEFMVAGTDYTVTDIQKGVGLETNQKTSALMRQLVLAEIVVRKEIKGRAYFTLA